MKVSLILTTYNCKDNLQQTLRSIDEQDHTDIEVVIADGMSTDGTLELIEEYSNSHAQVTWKSEKDQGIYDAMNKAIQMSTGDIIAVQNDVFSDSHCITDMVQIMEKTGYDGAHADLVYANEDKIIRYWHMGQGTINQGWMPGHPTLYLRREIYNRFGLYDISYKCSADFEFMTRILKDGSVKLAYMPKVLVKMFYGGTSTASANSYMTSIRESYQALKKNGYKRPAFIIFRRILRTVWQFIGK